MTAAAIPCPSCLAAPGEWCRRHGQTQPGPLLYCPERVEDDPAQCVECDAPLDEYACPTCSPLDVVCVECCDCPPDLYRVEFD